MDILSWIRDKMYTDGASDPSLADYDPLDPSSTPPTPKRLTTTGRVIKGLPGILQSGIAAAATPNIAYGGPTDIFRAMQAGQAATQDRDLLNYNINRQQRQDAQGFSQKRLEDAIKWAQLENTQEGTQSLIAQRKQQEEDRQNTLKLSELARNLQLGQAGVQQMDDGAPASVEHITPGISLETNARPPQAMPGPYQFKDPFSGKTLVVGKKGDMELDPDVGAELGVTPNAEGKFIIPESGLRELIKNKLKTPATPKPDWDPETRAALIATGAVDPLNPTADEMEKALQRKAQLHVGERPPVAPKEPSEALQDKRALAAARQKVFVENGNDWSKVLQNLNKYQADPTVAPYLDQVSDHAQKQVELGAKQSKQNSAMELLQVRANNASSTGGRILKQIDDLSKNYPTLFGGGMFGIPAAAAGSAAQGPIASRMLPQEYVNSARNLQTAIAMFFQQQPPLEGYRSTTAAENLKKAAGADGTGVFSNPQAVKSAIQELMDVNKQFATGLKTGKFPDGIQPPAELAGAISPGVPSPQASPVAAPAGTVAVIKSDGTRGFVPAAKAQDPAYIKKFGYMLAQQ